jgi:hypothetical protein
MIYFQRNITDKFKEEILRILQGKALKAVF